MSASDGEKREESKNKIKNIKKDLGTGSKTVHFKIRKIIKRPKNRPEAMIFDENECNRRRKTRGIQKYYQKHQKHQKTQIKKNSKTQK